MGAQFKETCYPDNQAAMDAFYLSQPLTVQPVSSDNVLFFFSKTSPSQWSLCRQLVTSDSPYGCSLVASPTFSSCTEPNDPATNMQNGLELGWGVASVVLVAFVWRFLRVRF